MQISGILISYAGKKKKSQNLKEEKLTKRIKKKLNIVKNMTDEAWLNNLND